MTTDTDLQEDTIPDEQSLLDTGHVFESDFRKENPSLHLLYTVTAVPHLRAIDRALQTFWEFSNLNMHGPAEALQKERNLLLTTNAAYCQADEILKSIKLTVDTRIVDTDEGLQIN